MRGGRPLRFLAILLCGWSGARSLDLYRRSGDVPGVGAGARAVSGPIDHLAAAIGVPKASAAARSFVAPVAPAHAMIAVPTAVASHQFVRPPTPAGFAQATVREPERHRDPAPAAMPAPLLSPAVLPPPVRRTGGRLTGSAWLIARDGAAAGVSNGQLGGSQAGARITYALGTRRRLALAARVSAPLSGRGREAAIGFDWQPTRAPVHVIAERRIALDGGRGGPTLGIVGGYGPAEVVRGVQLEGYGQAGVIARDGAEAFADGAVRVAHPLGRVGALRLDVGAGLWGGAQRGAARLDVGPSVGVVVPVGRTAFRLTADWRERIAGDARPGSGPALSLGTNF